MRKKIEHYWKKKYRKILFIGTVIASPLTWWLSSFENSLLLVTTIILFWYTRETYDLKVIGNKQLKEVRKQRDLQLSPYLRLQWHNGLDDGVYDIVNEGEGLALDIIFEPMKFLDSGIQSVYKIESRPLIVKSNPTIVTTRELRQDSNIIDGVNIKGYLSACIARKHRIKASYHDIEGRKYVVIFQSDESYNDKFKIVKQARVG